MPVTSKRTVKSKARTAARRKPRSHSSGLCSVETGSCCPKPMVPHTNGQRYRHGTEDGRCPRCNVEEIPFEMMNGNCQGYAKGRQIAINPLAQIPAKTTFHELAHIELGHTAEAVHDSETLPRSLREVEAEASHCSVSNRSAWMVPNIAVDIFRIGCKVKTFPNVAHNGFSQRRTRSSRRASSDRCKAVPNEIGISRNHQRGGPTGPL
jgi:hypothetical protein